MQNNLKEITDPTLLSELDNHSNQKEVTDPELLSQLEGKKKSQQETLLPLSIPVEKTSPYQPENLPSESGSVNGSLESPTEVKTPEIDLPATTSYHFSDDRKLSFGGDHPKVKDRNELFLDAQNNLKFNLQNADKIQQEVDGVKNTIDKNNEQIQQLEAAKQFAPQDQLPQIELQQKQLSDQIAKATPLYQTSVQAAKTYLDKFKQTGEDINKSIGEYNKLKPEDSYGEGAIKTGIEATADMIHSLGGVVKAVNNSIGLNTPDQDNQLYLLADKIKNTTSGWANIPDTFAGEILSGISATAPLIVETALLAPTGMAALPIAMGLNAFGDTYSKTNSYLEATSKGAEGALTGAILHGLGYVANKTAASVINKEVSPVLSKTLAATLAASGFGGYGVGEKLAKGEEVTWDDFAVNAGVGLGLELPGFIKVAGTKGRTIEEALYQKALNTTLTISPETVKQAADMPISPEQMREKATKAYEESLTETDPEKKRTLALTAKVFTSMADAKSVVHAIAENPQDFIKGINNSNLPEAKKIELRDHIQQISIDNNPNKAEAKPISEQIDFNNKIKEKIENTTNIGDFEKQAQIKAIDKLNEGLQDKLNFAYSKERYIIDGRDLTKDEFSKKIGDNQFIANVADGKIDVNIKNNDELGQLLNEKIKIYKDEKAKETQEALLKETEVKPKPEPNAVQIESSEPLSAFPTSRNSEEMGQGISQSKETAGTQGSEIAPSEPVQLPNETVKKENVKQPPKLSERQSKINDVHSDIKEYNALKNGRLGKETPNGRKLLNSISLKAKELELKIDNKNAGITLRNSKNRIVRPNYQHLGNRAINEDYVPLEKKSKQVQDVFNKLNDAGVNSFPNIFGEDGKRMSEAQKLSAINDVINDNPINQAHQLLTQLEQQVNDGHLILRHEGVDHIVPIDKILNENLSDAEEIPHDEQQIKDAKEYEDYYNSLNSQEQEVINNTEHENITGFDNSRKSTPNEEIKAETPTDKTFGGNNSTGEAKPDQEIKNIPTREEVLKNLSEKKKSISDIFKSDKTNPGEDSKDIIQNSIIPLKPAVQAVFKPLSKSQNFWSEKIIEPAEQWVASKIKQWNVSQNNIKRSLGQGLTSWANGLPRTQRELTDYLKFKGGISAAKENMARTITSLRKIIDNNLQSLEKVHEALDPDFYEGQENISKASDLNDSEKNLYQSIRKILDYVHDYNYALGFIDDATYAKFKGKYTPRMYETFEVPEDVEKAIEEGSHDIHNKKLDISFIKARKEIDDYKRTTILKDPIYSAAKRMMQTEVNASIKSYIDKIATNKDLVSDDPKKGFIQLQGKGYGNLNGKYVPNYIAEDFKGYFFGNKVLDLLYDASKLYDRNQLRQFIKKYHTVYNPSVQLGNLSSNYVFSFLSGIDPVTMTSKMPEALKEVNSKGKTYDLLVENGILKSSLLENDLIPLTEKTKPVIEGDKKENILTKAERATSEIYGKTDDVSKMAAFLSLKDYGYTDEQAIKKVYNGFQNYSTVGKIWDAASKTPVLGNAFVKFQADLQRIMKNAVLKQPLSAAMFAGLLITGAEIASKLSGESEDEKELREGRQFIPKIKNPIKDIPLTFMTPYGEVNLARYLSPYYNYDTNDASIESYSKMLPFKINVTEDKEKGTSSVLPAFDDPFLGVYGQALLQDRDFRGKSIQDPEASKYKASGISSQDKMLNALNYIARSQVPFYSSAQDMVLANSYGTDFYGRDKNNWQVLLSQLVKTEGFPKEKYQEVAEKKIKSLQFDFNSLEQTVKEIENTIQKEQQKAKDQLDKKLITQTQFNNTTESLKLKLLERKSNIIQKESDVQKEFNEFMDKYKQFLPAKKD